MLVGTQRAVSAAICHILFYVHGTPCTAEYELFCGHGTPCPYMKSLFSTCFTIKAGEFGNEIYIALQIQEIYDRFLSGYSINSIQRYMSEKYGGWKSKTVINTVLRNSTYIGKVKFNKMTYDGIHVPIIYKDTFEKAQKVF